MSNYQAHFFTGLVITILAGLFVFYWNYLSFTPQNICWLLAICFVFSLLPDIDIGTSTIRKVFLIAFIVFIFFNGIGTIGYILGVIVIIIQFLPHRWIMHTFIMGLLLSGMLYFYFYNWVFPIVAILNFISHLALDEF